MNRRRLAGGVAGVILLCAVATTVWSGRSAAVEVDRVPAATAVQVARLGSQGSFTDATVQTVVVAVVSSTHWTVTPGGWTPLTPAQSFDPSTFGH